LAIFKYRRTPRKCANYPSVKLSTNIGRVAMAIEQVFKLYLKFAFQIHQNKIRIATDRDSTLGRWQLESLGDALRHQRGNKWKRRLPMNMGFGKQKR